MRAGAWLFRSGAKADGDRTVRLGVGLGLGSGVRDVLMGSELLGALNVDAVARAPFPRHGQRL